MRAILILFTLAFCAISHAQTTKYTGGSITYERDLPGSSYDEVKPLGRNVTVIYDSFFKSYKVIYSDVSGYKKSMLFVHDGTIYNQYVFNRVPYSVMMEKLTLGFAKQGEGYISFSDLRKMEYGGTHVSYNIVGLSLSK